MYATISDEKLYDGQFLSSERASETESITQILLGQKLVALVVVHKDNREEVEQSIPAEAKQEFIKQCLVRGEPSHYLMEVTRLVPNASL